MKRILSAWAPFLAAMILASCALGFFDRPIMFYDEVINLAHAQVGMVFNYALRPVFYGLNVLATRALGQDIHVLYGLMFGLFALGGVYIYRYMVREANLVSALSALSVYAWMGWTYSIGLNAMPHLPPLVFMLVALYYLHSGPIEQMGTGRVWRVSLFAWLSMFSHPTAIALLAGFYLVVARNVLTAAWEGGWSRFRLARQVVLWGLPAVVSLGGVEVLYHFFSVDSGDYFGSLVRGLHKTRSQRFAIYAQGYGYYFEEIALKYLGALALLLCAAIVAGLQRMYGHRDSGRKSSDVRFPVHLIDLSILALVPLFIVSFVDWKFHRVAVTFAPLIGLLVVRMAFWLLRDRGVVHSLFGALFVTVALLAFASSVGDAKTRWRHRAQSYSSDLDRAKSIDGVSIYLTGRCGIHGLNLLQAAGKQPVCAPAGKGETLARRALASGFRYVAIDTRGTSGFAIAARRSMQDADGHKVTSYYAGDYELWDLTPSYLGSTLEHSLSGLTRRSKVILVAGDPISANPILWSLRERGYRVDLVPPDSIHDLGGLDAAVVVSIRLKVEDDVHMHKILSKFGFRKVAGSGHVGLTHLSVWKRDGG